MPSVQIFTYRKAEYVAMVVPIISSRSADSTSDKLINGQQLSSLDQFGVLTNEFSLPLAPTLRRTRHRV